MAGEGGRAAGIQLHQGDGDVLADAKPPLSRGTNSGDRPSQSRQSRSVKSKYRLLGLVGRGQFGRVFCAIHRATGEMVALKQVDPERFSTAKFLRELRFLVTLSHPNVVSWQGYDHFEEGRYLVMDYCEGGNLRHWLNQRDGLRSTGAHQVPLGETIGVMRDVLEGLAHAHSHGIIHCDVKPENILLHWCNGVWQARLSDFGIACMSHESSGKQDSLHGSPAYMAPERFFGEMTTASDIYAVGVVWFELLTGDRPFSGAPGELIQAHREQTIALPEDLPVPWQVLLRKALHKNPQERFANAREMLVEVQLLMAALPQPTVPQPARSASLPLRPLIPASQRPHRATNWELILPERIQQILIQGQKTFLQTAKGLYQWQPGDLTKIKSWAQPTLVTIADSKPWITTLQASPSLDYQLQVYDVATRRDRYGRSVMLWTTPQALFALDHQYLLLISQRHGWQSHEAETCWTIYNRRGQCFYELPPLFEVSYIVKCPGMNRLLAIAPQEPKTLIVLDYQPFQIRQIPIAIGAKRMTSAPWGYVVMDAQGRIEVLDSWGCPIGKMQTPHNPSAIAMQNQTTLLIASQESGMSQLVQIDLRPLLTQAGIEPVI
jgi:serine/threonine protein kinase